MMVRSKKRIREDTNEFTSPNPQPNKQAKNDQHDVVVDHTTNEQQQEEDSSQESSPDSIAAAATMMTTTTTTSSTTTDSAVADTTTTATSTTTATTQLKSSSAFYVVSTAAMRFKPILKQDEIQETQTFRPENKMMMPPPRPPKINNPSPRKSSSSNNETDELPVKESSPPPPKPQETCLNKEQHEAVLIDNNRAESDAIFFSFSYKRWPLIQWKNKRQAFVGIGSVILSLSTVTLSLFLVMQAYYRTSCTMETGKLRQQLISYEALVDSRFRDRDLFEQQQQEIRMWKRESAVKQAQMVAVQEQCTEDWNRVHACSKTPDAEVVNAVKADLWALQESRNSQQVEKLQQEVEELQKNYEMLEVEAKQKEQSIVEMVDMLELERNNNFALREELEYALEDLEAMESNIQEYSRDRLISWLGEGPYYEVEVQLKFANDDPDAFQYMTIELDGQHMPHSVFTFLSQVEAGAYNSQDGIENPSFSFHHNAVHIVFGSPYEPEGWWSSKVPRLLFREYSDHAPHQAYTLGWNGMGPDLYFNVRDNVELHGSIGDPCFGKVTRGEALVDRMHGATGQLGEDDWKEFPDDVVVISIVIL
eukprot:scaffold713_cov131-Cylindrotheca_fusiformis.AAC.2